MDFDTAFDRLIGNEGGYVNNPNDPGGETNWGISKRSYPNVDIRSLTRDGAKAIYLRDFWERVHADEMHGAVAFQAFDFAVNSGIGAAIRALQSAAGVAADGIYGPATHDALAAANPAALVMRLVASMLDHWRSLSTWPNFGRGWAGRAAQNLRYAAEDV